MDGLSESSDFQLDPLARFMSSLRPYPGAAGRHIQKPHRVTVEFGGHVTDFRYPYGVTSVFDAPEGRYLTVRGRLIGSAEGYIGRAPYRYPILADARWALWKSGFQFDDAQWALGVGVAL